MARGQTAGSARSRGARHAGGASRLRPAGLLGELPHLPDLQCVAEGWTNRPDWACCARGADVPGSLRVNSQRLAVMLSHFTLPCENACYFQPWLRPHAPVSTLSPVRVPVCGLRQFLRTQRPPESTLAPSCTRPDARRNIVSCIAPVLAVVVVGRC